MTINWAYYLRFLSISKETFNFIALFKKIILKEQLRVQKTTVSHTCFDFDDEMIEMELCVSPFTANM